MATDLSDPPALAGLLPQVPVMDAVEVVAAERVEPLLAAWWDELDRLGREAQALAEEASALEALPLPAPVAPRPPSTHELQALARLELTIERQRAHLAESLEREAAAAQRFIDRALSRAATLDSIAVVPGPVPAPMLVPVHPVERAAFTEAPTFAPVVVLPPVAVAGTSATAADATPLAAAGPAATVPPAVVPAPQIARQAVTRSLSAFLYVDVLLPMVGVLLLVLLLLAWVG